MKTKTIISTVLLLFILASVTYLVVQEVRSGRQSPPARTNPQAVVVPNEPSSDPVLPDVVVYYFHGTARCPTCRKFESYSDEAVKEAFSDALEAGWLEWRVVNVDELGNEHFVSDYQLYTRSVVIVKNRDGKQAEWKNLKRIWELVGDKRAFVKYVQDEVTAYMGAE